MFTSSCVRNILEQGFKQQTTHSYCKRLLSHIYNNHNVLIKQQQKIIQKMIAFQGFQQIHSHNLLRGSPRYNDAKLKIHAGRCC